MTDRSLVVVTGANSGVGFEAVRILARAGRPVVMVCRSPERGEAAIQRILAEVPGADLRLERCELDSLSQVRNLAARLDALCDTGDTALGGLVNNAGLYRAPLERTEDGLERTMAVNHLSHFLLTLLLEKHLRRPGARVVNVTSRGHRGGQLHRRPVEEILRGEGRYIGWRAYADSKLAQVHFTQELHRRWGPEGTQVFALHPGVLSTAIWDRNPTVAMFMAKLMKPFMESPAVGGDAAARLVLDPDVAPASGGYFRKRARLEPSRLARDEALARRVWDASSAAVGL